MIDMHFLKHIAIFSCLLRLLPCVSSANADDDNRTYQNPLAVHHTNTVDLYYGTIVLPSGFKCVIGGIDSSAGSLIRTNDGFTVSFDIGHMAGYQMHADKAGNCVYFREHEVNGIYCSTGILVANGVKRIISTFNEFGILQRRLQAGIDNLDRTSTPHDVVKDKVQEADKIWKDFMNVHSQALRELAPANFWANIKDDSQLMDFLLIVTSYCPYKGSPASVTSVAEPRGSGVIH